MRPSSTNQTQFEDLRNEVLSALLAQRPDLARKPLRKMEKLFPNHAIIEVYRQWAAVLKFSWPAEKEWRPLVRRQSAPAGIDIVMFYVDLPTSPSGIHLDGLDLLNTACASFQGAALRAPHARRIFLTDFDTPIPDNLNADEVIRVSIDREFPMYERMKAQENYLATRPNDRATVFIDVDIVINRDPIEMFEQDFDLGLTWRSQYPNQPINGGFLLAAPGNGAKTLFQNAVLCYEALALDPKLKQLWQQDLRTWWGDQIAWTTIIGYHDFAQHSSSVLRVNDATVRLLPCDEYNFTPEPNISYPPQFLSSRYALHFKGNRKPMLNWYLELMRAEKL
jgi:hypothetical protein